MPVHTRFSSVLVRQLIYLARDTHTHTQAHSPVVALVLSAHICMQHRAGQDEITYTQRVPRGDGASCRPVFAFFSHMRAQEQVTPKYTHAHTHTCNTHLLRGKPVFIFRPPCCCVNILSLQAIIIIIIIYCL